MHMARKKSVKIAAGHFSRELEQIKKFVESVQFSQSVDEFTSWSYDYAVIRAYAAFEDLILNALVGAINNNTSIASATLEVQLPHHLTDEVCRYLVTGGGYFNFHGRSGLIAVLKKYLPQNHYLVTTCSKGTYKVSLDRLSAFRNFAAHRSTKARSATLLASSLKRIASAGAWLKRQGRLEAILDDLACLAIDLQNSAPF
jgi:hypothetical protein